LQQRIEILSSTTLDTKAKSAALSRISMDRDEQLKVSQDAYLKVLNDLNLMTETYRVNRDEYLRVSNELNVTATAKH
jgi:hypothetical protein